MFAAGGLAYIAFALIATIVTDASARRLVASETIRELALYLRAVAAAFDPETEFEQAYGSAIRQQAALSEQLQSARALLLVRARPGSEKRRLAATIGILLEAFDALVAAQSDIDAHPQGARRRRSCSGASAKRCASARSTSTI